MAGYVLTLLRGERGVPEFVTSEVPGGRLFTPMVPVRLDAGPVIGAVDAAPSLVWVPMPEEAVFVDDAGRSTSHEERRQSLVGPAKD